MNPQEIFDKVWDHFVVKENKRSVQQGSDGIGGEQCMYRGPDGTRCAAGLFISDDAYTPELEGENLFSRYVVEMLPEGAKKHLTLLRALQVAHDSSTGEYVEEARLRSVAEQFDLRVSVV